MDDPDDLKRELKYVRKKQTELEKNFFFQEVRESANILIRQSLTLFLLTIKRPREYDYNIDNIIISYII